MFTVRHAAGEERLLTLDTQSFFSNPSPPPPSLAFLLARVDAEYAILDMGIQPVHSEGDQPWDFFGRNDATYTQWSITQPLKRIHLNQF